MCLATTGESETQVQTYRVVWEIDIEAENPRKAAEVARFFQTAPDTTATVFDVRGETGEFTRVDLLQDEA
jgi:hypothetical protein